MLAQFKTMIISIFMAADIESTQPAINMDNINNLKEVACLSQAVHGEAGNQTFQGKIAVAHVILNRTKDESFPETTCEVVSQRGQFDFLKKVKFINKEKPLERAQMEESIKAAVLVVNGTIPDPTRGALFFANPKVSTDKAWLRKLRKIVRIDDHVFYLKPKAKTKLVKTSPNHYKVQVAQN